jgi:quercetin dioxygenase-like cupin family protein
MGSNGNFRWRWLQKYLRAGVSATGIQSQNSSLLLSPKQPDISFYRCHVSSSHHCSGSQRAAAQTEEMRMMSSQISSGLLRSMAAAFVISTGFAFSAQAGECPADKKKMNAREAVNVQASGVTDTTLGSIDLGKEAVNIKGHELRFRKMVIQPGGVVPWHSHDERPALIYVAEGDIVEFSSNCAGPIKHKAGDIAIEKRGTAHWWKNLSEKPVTLFIGDVRSDPNDKHM